ncbi:MAG TPA: divalent-cation tolerance protein CutA [Chthoniobacterales bacterium]|jgi:periplasmic divalent cation tolerance protein
MTPSPPEVRLLVTTFAKEADATSAVRMLIREKLAACGTLFHRARSIYIWDGKLEDTEEIVVWIKTSPTRTEAAAQRLREIHPYDCPEILTLDAQSLNPAYTSWVNENTKAP